MRKTYFYLGALGALVTAAGAALNENWWAVAGWLVAAAFMAFDAASGK